MQTLRDQTVRFLRWTEQYTKTDMVYLFKNGFFLLAGQGISIIASLVVAYMFANFLPKETYGTYKFVLSIAGVLAIFTLPKMSTAITQATAKGFEGSLIRGTKERLRWSLIGSLVALGCATYYTYQDNAALAISMLILGLFLPFYESFGGWNAYLQGHKDFKTSTLYALITSVLAAVAIVLTIFFSKSLWVILTVYFASYTILRLFFFVYTIKKSTPVGEDDPTLFSYARHLTGMNILNSIGAQFDKILLFHFLGPIQVAIYSIALAVPEQIRSALKNIGVLALPKFSSRSMAEIRETLVPRLARLGIFTICISLAYVGLAPFIFRFFFPAYMESVFLSQLLSLSLVGVINNPIIIALEAQQKTRELYIFQTLSPLLGIVLLTCLVPSFGMLGAVISYTTLNVFKVILAFVLLWKSR